MNWTRRLVAIGCSVLVHIGVLAWLWSRADEVVPAPPNWTAFELTEAPPKPRKIPSPQRGEGQGEGPRRTAVQPTQPTQPTQRTQPTDQLTTDTPRAVTLTPRADQFITTTEPGPQTETETDIVTTRVDGWLKGSVARARTSNGVVSPEYEPLGRALRHATDDVPQFINTNNAADVGIAVLQGWQPGAERYGKTGSAYAAPEGRIENFERPSALSDVVERIGDPHTKAALSFFAAGARLQEFADGRAGGSLVAIVEIRQHADGTFAGVTMLTPSGHPSLDTWVLEQSRSVAESFALDAGTRTKPFRSVWRFEGTLKFRRKLKNLKDLTPRAALGFITMAALSALSGAGNSTPEATLGPRMPAMSGRFDENTGALDVVDLTNPQWDCKVSLLEAD